MCLHVWRHSVNALAYICIKCLQLTVLKYIGSQSDRFKKLCLFTLTFKVVNCSLSKLYDSLMKTIKYFNSLLSKIHCLVRAIDADIVAVLYWLTSISLQNLPNLICILVLQVRCRQKFAVLTKLQASNYCLALDIKLVVTTCVLAK